MEHLKGLLNEDTNEDENEGEVGAQTTDDGNHMVDYSTELCGNCKT